MESATAADVGRIGYRDVAALPRCQLQDDKNDERRAKTEDIQQRITI